MIEILETKPDHVLLLRENLREQDASEICKFGLPIRKALWRSYKNSIFCRTAFVDGQIAGIWGLHGVLLGETGCPWLLTSPIVERFPIHFALLYRQEIREMQDYFDKLENWVDAAYSKSIRMLELIGFTVDEPVKISVLKSDNLFRKFHLESRI